MNAFAFNPPLGPRLRSPIPSSSPWLGDVVPAAAWALGARQPWADRKAAKTYDLPGANQVMIILADGLGIYPLMNRLGYARTLRGMGSEPTVAQTCAPSTTAAAITTFATGQSPAKTNMVGYSVLHGRVMNLLNFQPGVNPEQWQPAATLFEKMGEVGFTTALVTAPKFKGSGLTRASLRGAVFVGTDSLEARFEAALNAFEEGADLAVLYWAELDKIGHQHGPNSPQWSEALEEFDRELGRFLMRVPEDIPVLLTADHGMVQVEKRIDIADAPTLAQDVTVLAGEGRAVHVHAVAGRSQQVIERWGDYLAGGTWLFPKETMSHVVGDGPGVHLMGDLLAMPTGSTVIVDSRSQPRGAIAMKGVHGSLTEEEMLVPVWRLN